MLYNLFVSFPALLNSLLLYYYRGASLSWVCVDTPKKYFQDITKGVADLYSVHGKITLCVPMVWSSIHRTFSAHPGLHIIFDTLNIIPEYSVDSQNGEQADCVHGRAT